MQGYRDQLDFGLIAGANVLPELHSLARMLPEELEALERSFGLAPEAPIEQAAPKKAATPTKSGAAAKAKARA